MRIKDAPLDKNFLPIFDLSNKAAGESSTYRAADKYDDYENVDTNNMFCQAVPKGKPHGGNLPIGAQICPTDGAPFEVFTTMNSDEYKGDYWQKNHLHHTANGQALRTYRHDLDNTELYFAACDDAKSEWSYAHSKFDYVEKDFDIIHLIPPEQQIKQLDVTKPVPIPAKLGCFKFFDHCYTSVAMSGHGYISFGGTVGDDFTESISEWGKYKMIAALWDDLNPNGAADPGMKMGIPKNVYAVHDLQEHQMIFQWHYIPETAHNYKNQQTTDENIFRIVLDFDTNEIIIKTGEISTTDGIVGITGGLKKSGEQWGHHHVDFNGAGDNGYKHKNTAGKCTTYQG
jgi:hypothetical protein